MRRREFITLIAGATVTWPFASRAQQAGRTYRLGVLAAGPRSDEGIHAFFDGVRRQGFIEGQNLTVIYHDFTLKVDLLSEWAAELVKARVDVIYAVSRRTAGDKNHSDPGDYIRYARDRTSELTGAAKRQYNGR